MTTLIEDIDDYKRLKSGCSCGCGTHCGHSCMTDDCDCNECLCLDCKAEFLQQKGEK